ncbi:MAG: rhomboid family intramembrane serine protease [Deltaproteobacteria bacterium]|nr:rhomboid family intramembrane serine protease [Deltaproteobacteria bacterium]
MLRRARVPVTTLLFVLSLAFAHWLDVRTRVRTGLGFEPLPGRFVFDGESPTLVQSLGYAWIHVDSAHLTSNVVTLALFGTLAEQRAPHGRFAMFLLLSCVAVSRGFHLVDARDLYGASGVAASVVAFTAIYTLSQRDRSAVTRALVLALSLAYVAFTELKPLADGLANPGWIPHCVGYAFGTTVGLCAVMARYFRMRFRAQKSILSASEITTPAP